MAVSDIYFLEVSADVSKKVVTKNPFRDKKKYENLDFYVIFLKQKRRSATKKLWKFSFLVSFLNDKKEECDQKK